MLNVYKPQNFATDSRIGLTDQLCVKALVELQMGPQALLQHHADNQCQLW